MLTRLASELDGNQKGMESQVIPANNIAIDYMTVQGVRGKGTFALMKMPVMLIRACWQARKILQKRQPDVVLGMGGFVAGPGGLLAKLMGIPLVIHEQNRIPGTTNRLLANMANKVLEAFPSSFSVNKHAIFTGNPLRIAFTAQYDDRENKSQAELRVLVMGGSLGAQRLNEVLPEALSLLGGVEVKHQTGAKMQQQVSQAYIDKSIKASVVTFIEDVVAAYQWADIVICRAGAMTVSEVAAMGVPAVFVPYPYAIDDHQTANAQYLVAAGAGVMIAQQQLSAELLCEKIKSCVNRLSDMAQAAQKSAKLDATQLVAEQCILEAA
jgi:UDP-N-acetylglucosamine--N-acetylmuramyl-(pentapeptide) pyrophosphoryl-undecaprenol N-acetylglucosamine transferase